MCSTPWNQAYSKTTSSFGTNTRNRCVIVWGAKLGKVRGCFCQQEPHWTVLRVRYLCFRRILCPRILHDHTKPCPTQITCNVKPQQLQENCRNDHVFQRLKFPSKNIMTTGWVMFAHFLVLVLCHTGAFVNPLLALVVCQMMPCWGYVRMFAGRKLT